MWGEVKGLLRFARKKIEELKALGSLGCACDIWCQYEKLADLQFIVNDETGCLEVYAYPVIWEGGGWTTELSTEIRLLNLAKGDY